VTSISRPLQKLTLDLEELLIAFEAEAVDLRWYLDTQTGDVILVTHEYDPSEHGGLTTRQLEADEERFRPVPTPAGSESRDDMSAYVAQLSDAQLRESLEIALSAGRPERRFRAVLGWLPERQDDWRAFRQARCAARARAWLAACGFEPVLRIQTD
jgi:hypothetical protein